MVTYVLPKSQHSKYVKGALLADGSCGRACRSTMTLADRSSWTSTRGLCSALSSSPSPDVRPVSLSPYVLSPVSIRPVCLLQSRRAAVAAAAAAV